LRDGAIALPKSSHIKAKLSIRLRRGVPATLRAQTTKSPLTRAFSLALESKNAVKRA
jgi:hypothetical protein